MITDYNKGDDDGYCDDDNNDGDGDGDWLSIPIDKFLKSSKDDQFSRKEEKSKDQFPNYI